MNAKRACAFMAALITTLAGCGQSDLMESNNRIANTAVVEQSSIATQSEIADAEQITLTLASYGSNAAPIVREFNESQSTYQIELVDYSQDGTVSKETARKQLNAELASGEGPDIFYLWKLGMSPAIYGPKGYLEDLLPYLDSDTELSRDDFVESLMNGAMIDGKLYSTIPSFSILTMFGPKSEVEGLDFSSFSAVSELAQSSGEASCLFNQSYTGAEFLSTIVQFASDEFVDFGAMTANFDSDNFRALLELCSQFDETLADRDTPAILNLYTINSFMETQYYETVYGEEISFIGLPGSAEPQNYFMDILDQYGINANSKHKDGAWSFIRLLFTEEYQMDEYVDSAFPSFPSNKNALNALAEKAMTTLYEENEDGTKSEITQRGAVDGFAYHAATQAQTDQILKLIDATSQSSYYTDTILSIVDEEAAAYFDGSATADETIEKIQNRVNIYLSEIT